MLLNCLYAFIIVYSTQAYTVRCCYNAVSVLKNIHERHPIARPLGRGMGCLLWIQQFLQSFMQYLTILDRAIMTLDCIFAGVIVTILLLLQMYRGWCQKRLIIAVRIWDRWDWNVQRDIFSECKQWRSSFILTNTWVIEVKMISVW